MVLILQVNHSPSFEVDTALDEEIKSRAIADAVRSLGLSVRQREDVIMRLKRATQQRLYGSRPASSSFSTSAFASSVDRPRSVRDVFSARITPCRCAKLDAPNSELWGYRALERHAALSLTRHQLQQGSSMY
jgi:hypothetical protein